MSLSVQIDFRTRDFHFMQMLYALGRKVDKYMPYSNGLHGSDNTFKHLNWNKVWLK